MVFSCPFYTSLKPYLHHLYSCDSVNNCIIVSAGFNESCINITITYGTYYYILSRLISQISSRLFGNRGVNRHHTSCRRPDEKGHPLSKWHICRWLPGGTDMARVRKMVLVPSAPHPDLAVLHMPLPVPETSSRSHYISLMRVFFVLFLDVTNEIGAPTPTRAPDNQFRKV